MPDVTLKSGWTGVAFGDVVRLSRVRSSDPEAAGFERYVGLDHIEPGDLRIRRWGDTADGTTFTSVFRPGQVLFGKRRAYQRKVAVADFSGVCSGDIYVFEPRNSHLLPEFLPVICQTDHFFEHAIGTSAGSLSPRTNWQSLASYQLALPPLDEQRRVAAAMSAMLALDECLLTALRSVEKVRASAAKDLFDPVPHGWPVHPIGDVLTVHTGGTPSRGVPDHWDGEVPWVKTGEVNFGLITETEEHITEDGLRQSAAKICPVNSVLVALYGQGPTRGRVALLGIDAATNQACAAIVPSSDFDPSFVYYYLESKYSDLRAMAHGAAQPNLNLSMIKGFPIPVPPLAEQRSLVDLVSAVARGHAALAERRSVLRSAMKQHREEAVR